MVLDHIGIAVKSMDAAVEHWARVFDYHRATETITNTRQKVNVAFLEKEGALPIKLIEPTDESSPIYAFARRGGGLHHLCFRCPDVDEETARLKSLGLRVLAQPQPGEAFDNEKIAFVFAKQGLNIELIDTDKRAGRLSAGSD